MSYSLIMWLGVSFGVVVGIMGGAFRTYMSVKNTKGPEERAFMVRCAIFAWLSIIIFLGLLYLIPMPYNFILWVPYSLFLPLAIRYSNKKQNKIRENEQSV